MQVQPHELGWPSVCTGQLVQCNPGTKDSFLSRQTPASQQCRQSRDHRPPPACVHVKRYSSPEQVISQLRGVTCYKVVLVVQWLSVGLVVERSLVRLAARVLSSQLGQLSLPSLRGRQIEYRSAWLRIRRGVFASVGQQVTLCDPIWQVTLRSCVMEYLLTLTAIQYLYLFTFYMGSYSVTCHPTQVNTPCRNHRQTGCYSIYLSRKDGRLS